MNPSQYFYAHAMAADFMDSYTGVTSMNPLRDLLEKARFAARHVGLETFQFTGDGALDRFHPP